MKGREQNGIYLKTNTRTGFYSVPRGTECVPSGTLHRGLAVIIERVANEMIQKSQFSRHIINMVYRAMHPGIQ